MAESVIFSKIDYYTAMWSGCSIRDILDYLQLDYLQDEFFENAVKIACGFESYYTFYYQQIKIGVPMSVLLLHPKLNIEDFSILDFVFESLRVDIAGQALDNLRQLWHESGFEIPVDTYLRTPFEPVRGSMHVTRCDFAYDLIDYKPDFLDQIMDYLHELKSSRVCIFQRQGGLSYSLKFGGREKTVYLGSTRSSEILRIYDKKLESTNEDGLWKKDAPYPDCDSWIRIELQCRHDRAHGICFGDGDIMTIFRYIYDHYAFRDMRYSTYTQKVSEFWANLFDWDNLPPIIQNLQIREVVDEFARATKYVLGTAFSSILVMVAHLGKEGFFEEIDKKLEFMQAADRDQITTRRFRSMLFKLKNSCISKLISDLPGLRVLNGILKLREKSKIIV